MKAGRIVALVFGCLIGLIGLGVLAAGIVGTVAATTARDADGFLRSDEATLTTPTAAISSENVDLGGNFGSSWITDRGDLATVSLNLRPTSKEIFAGIGPTADVERYLTGISHELLTDFSSSTDITLERRDGAASVAPPAEQTFWAAQVSTTQPGALTWDVQSGNWSAVIMNADGSGGIDVGVEAGVKLDWLLPVSIVAIVVGFIMLAGGTVMAVLAGRGPRQRPPLPPVGGPGAPPGAPFPTASPGQPTTTHPPPPPPVAQPSSPPPPGAPPAGPPPP